ncbi:MAG: FtsX-like permease family protein [Christensenellaceae bacterium]|jgi:ABC-type antimicrobial peptide transport system permease subunit|nr:FtsX-like permease family protein [Christensenellaceae bacterium]
MRNYNYHTASVNTYRNLDISTLSLIKNRVETDFNGDQVNVPIELDKESLKKIENAYANPFSAYACGIEIKPYSAVNFDALSNNEKIFKSEISAVVESAEDITENTLKGFYNAKLLAGNYPTLNEEAVEILISDYTADSIMFFGGRFDSVTVYPNTGYEGLLGATVNYSGLTLKIVGIFSTDYKDTAFAEERNAEYRFNLSNSYAAALTVKNALYSLTRESTTVPTSGYFEIGEDYLNYNLTVTSVTKADDLSEAVGLPMLSSLLPVVYKTGYNAQTELQDNEIIISKTLLDGLLQKNELDENYEQLYTFANVVAADFEEFRFNLTLLDASREVSFANLKIVGVFNDGIDLGLIPGAAEIIAQLDGMFIANSATKNAFIEKGLVITNAYLPLHGGVKEQKTLLKFLDGENISYLTYASAEIETMDLLFSMLSNILSGVSFVLFFFVMMLMLNFISVSVASKQKEIGILRSMGARGIDAAKIFIFEGAAVFLISLVFSIVLSFAGIAVLNAQLTKTFVNTISVLTAVPLTFIIATLGNALIITIGSLAPLLKIIKMKPIDAVKIVG